jgi:hypothetical protein
VGTLQALAKSAELGIVTALSSIGVNQPGYLDTTNTKNTKNTKKEKPFEIKAVPVSTESTALNRQPS